VDVRVIAATSRDLPAMMAQGQFRSDLYYRLNVLEILVPPLRERPADLGILCEGLLAELAGGAGPEAGITREALELLGRHSWPGNVRELRNVLERALTLAEDVSVVDVRALSQALPPLGTVEARRNSGGAPEDVVTLPVRPLADVVARAEADAINAALGATGGNRTRAARLLGVSRSALYEKLGKLS
jgi:transcriptional regulator with PAS, ATPase and Fis domain